MSEYNTKNYTEQGGDVTHIGGKLIIEDGAEVEGLDGGGGSYTLPTASADTLGGVKAAAKTTESVPVAVDTDGKLYVPAYPVIPKMEKQDDCSSDEMSAIKTALNDLLAKLKTAGLMKSE